MTQIFINSDRHIPRIRPLKALRHFRNLIANKEDTEQVFHIIESLNGRALLTDLEKFAATEAGQARIKTRRYLPPLLDDHAALARLPDGSVGRAYLDFMTREGLTAQGLVDEFEKFSKDWNGHDDIIDWYGNRLRDTHDLMHVLTGYGRDALGEACVLGFSYGQTKGRGVIFIAYMAGREVRKNAPTGAPVLRAVREGQYNGKAAKKICEEDIMILLEENLEEARMRLGIAPPQTYHKVHTMFKDAGINPYSALAAAE